MSIPTHLKSHLKQTHISYAAILHLPTRRAQYTASILHVPGKEVAKTVVFRTGKKHLLAVLPASYHVNLKKLTTVVGAPIRLSDELECNRLFPDCDAGAIPPFGELYGLPVYMDEALADNPEIVFNAGTRSDAIRMGNADFVRLTKARVCSFADQP
jgi:Ala-tRNA(Pro) deacylase